MEETTAIKLATRKRRLFAFLIDALIIGVFGWMIGWSFEDAILQLGNFGRAVGAVVVLLYFGICNSKLMNGQTLGKMLLNIRVVDKNSNYISVAKAILRALPFALYILLNGMPVSDSSDLYPSLILGTILFSIPVLEIYFAIANNKSLQSLHDLIAKTYVISAKSEGSIDFTNNKAILYAGFALPILILAVVFAGSSAVSNKLIYVKDMQKIVSAASQELPISSITMYRNKTAITNFDGETTQTKLIQVTATKKNKDENDTLLAVKIAKIIFDSGFTFEEDENLFIAITYGYDIGIASKYNSSKFNDTPKNWKEAVKAISILDKTSRKNKPTVDIKSDFWRNVANAQYIVSGTLNVDTNKIQEIKKSKGDYIEFNFVIDSVFKGDIEKKEITLRKFICDINGKENRCNDSNLFTLNGQKVIAPLVKSQRKPGQYAFIKSSVKGLQLATEENANKVSNEVKLQKEIIESKFYTEVCPYTKLADSVKTLIEDMLVASKAESAYVNLERLGKSAIPTIICQMDDRRELAIKSITFKNKSPDGTEKTWHYTPQVVTDVLAATLNFVSWNSFGYIFDGASEEERVSVINGWRIFLWYLING